MSFSIYYELYYEKEKDENLDKLWKTIYVFTI